MSSSSFFLCLSLCIFGVSDRVKVGAARIYKRTQVSLREKTAGERVERSKFMGGRFVRDFCEERGYKIHVP